MPLRVRGGREHAVGGDRAAAGASSATGHPYGHARAPRTRECGASLQVGSSEFATDTDGELYEHYEYFPFGETWVSEASNTQRLPYLFTSKELDEETELYYFGARYYDPRTSVWESADPAFAEYLTGKTNGVFDSRNLGLYGFAWNSPLIHVDTDGKVIILVGKAQDQAATLAMLSQISGAPLVVDNNGIVQVASGPPVAGRSQGMALVGGLVNSEETVTIALFRGTGPKNQSSTEIADITAAKQHEPTGASVRLDTRRGLQKTWVGDPNTATATGAEEPPLAIALAHELGHAKDTIEGAVNQAPDARTYRDASGRLRTERQRHWEYRAVRTENAIRREQGVKERVAIEPAVQ